MKTIAVIPARFGATRLPGKPLADIHGKPMVQWVYEAAAQARGISQVIVATDDARIFAAVEAFGGVAMMTSNTLTSGTDRVAAIADKLPADVYLNVQGDEPLIEPETIEAALSLVTESDFEMSSVMTRLKSLEELESRAVVKAIADRRGRALYFSRFAIPYSRNAAPTNLAEWACYRHLGLYVYRRSTLLKLRELEPSPLEIGESLEQLRALDNGISIGLGVVNSISMGVDLPEDLEKVKHILSQKVRES